MNRLPILVVGDLHLGPAAPAGTEEAMVELLLRHRDAEFLCLGDLFDLSADTSARDAAESVLAHLDRYSRLSSALGTHLSRGAPVTLVVGNHDAELGATGIREAILGKLDVAPTSDLTIERWWTRRGGFHLEHGHVWDPDNAPIHPLVATRHDNEPLGVALTRSVLAPTGAYQFAHAHHTTPLQGLIRALRELGARAPEIILRYFVTGARIFWRAATRGHEHTWRIGANAIDAFAKDKGLPSSIVECLTQLRPTPRHARAASTFARLYFDRAAATVAAVASGTVSLVEREPAYLLVAVAGLLYLQGSVGDRAHRYSASLVERVESAALGIGPLVQAHAVVFGHTHVPRARAGYANCGAFGFPGQQGRPYLLLEGNDRISRGWLGRSDELEPLIHVVA